MRADAFRALARTPDRRAINALLEGLASRNPAERNLAHLAIRNLGGKILKTVEAKAETWDLICPGWVRNWIAAHSPRPSFTRARRSGRAISRSSWKWRMARNSAAWSEARTPTR